MEKVKIEQSVQSAQANTNRTEPTVVEKQKTLLYDNSQDGFATELEFSVETTRRLIFEVSIPGSASGSATKSKLMKSSDMGCVGILVEHMLTPIQGFKGTGF